MNCKGTKIQLKNCIFAKKFLNSSYMMENQEIESQKIESQETNRRCKGNVCCVVGYGILAVAVIILFILHFMQPKSKPIPTRVANGSQTVIVTVNVDSITEHFDLVKLLKNDLEEEAAKYQKDLETKSIAFHTKVSNFETNYQNNVLTQTQIQNAQRQLMQEKETLEALEARYAKILMDKEMSVQNEIMDSLKNASRRVNEASYNADYIFAIGLGSNILHSNKQYDITDEVIKEMNDAYKKSTK